MARWVACKVDNLVEGCRDQAADKTGHLKDCALKCNPVLTLN